MTERKIHITEQDKKRLEGLILAKSGPGSPDRERLEALSQELARATVVPPDKVPSDVVTMNSKVVIRDEESSQETAYTLVFPDQADIDAGAISVLAPIGTAILGYSKGDQIEWPVPSGVRRIRIVKILYQPEAAGDYHL